ncbi:MAG: PhoH family protein [Chlamydiia bacterium]|nr:PhoH family protein [Chlamydiia bacterium]MCP5510036.1 PhoH family protein [Chlamydiales bacterium]
MTRKTYLIDTNVLLHDPEAMHTFKDSDVAIPVTVLEELDSKKHLTSELGRNARTAVRFINSLAEKGRLHEGIGLSNGTKFHTLMDAPNSERKPLSFDWARNKLLLSAYQLKEKGVPVVVVSKDFVMRVKAESLGIETRDYSLTEGGFDHLYPGYHTIETTKAEIDLFYKNGYIEGQTGDFLANGYGVMTCPEQSSAIVRFDKKQNKLLPLQSIKRDVWGIHPLNVQQRCAMDLLLNDNIKLITLIGPAGTGKTMMAVACGLRKVFDEDVYSRILISRPIMPLGKDIGYLPGTKEEKLFHWMQPIYDNLEYLCETTSGEGNAADTLTFVKESGKIEMEAVTYIRGRTLPRMFIIIDEAQNLTPHEIKTVVSRAGKGTKVILTGDPTQIDNPYLDKDSNALTYIVNKFKDQPIFGHIYLDRTERSELAALAAKIL